MNTQRPDNKTTDAPPTHTYLRSTRLGTIAHDSARHIFTFSPAGVSPARSACLVKRPARVACSRRRYVHNWIPARVAKVPHVFRPLLVAKLAYLVSARGATASCKQFVDIVELIVIIVALLLDLRLV